MYVDDGYTARRLKNNGLTKEPSESQMIHISVILGVLISVMLFVVINYSTGASSLSVTHL